MGVRWGSPLRGRWRRGRGDNVHALLFCPHGGAMARPLRRRVPRAWLRGRRARHGPFLSLKSNNDAALLGLLVDSHPEMFSKHRHRKRLRGIDSGNSTAVLLYRVLHCCVFTVEKSAHMALGLRRVGDIAVKLRKPKNQNGKSSSSARFRSSSVMRWRMRQ